MTRRSFAYVGALLAVLSAHPAARAAEDPAPAVHESVLFEDVPEVFSASRYSQRATEAPASVTVLSGETLRAYGVRTVGEALRLVPGLFLHYDRIYEFAGFRGFALPGDFNTRILVQLDGHVLNNSVVTGGSNIGTDLGVDVDEIERLEFIKGPASALYGGNAFLGTINIVTRRPVAAPGTDTTWRYGSSGRKDVLASWNGSLDKGDEIWVGARLLDARGGELFFQEYDDPTTNDGVAERTDFDRAWSGRVFFHRGRFSLATYAAARNKGLPTAPFLTTFDSRTNRNRDFRGFLDASYRFVDTPNLTVQGRGTLDRYQFDDFLDYTSSGDVLFRDNGQDNFVGSEVQVDWKPDGRQRWLAGASVERHNARQQSGFVNQPPAARDVRQYLIQNLFVQDEVRASRLVRFVFGAHLHHHQLFESRLSPRLAAVVNPLGKTRCKLLYNEGFRTPTLFEAYFEDSLDFIANPDLRPERVRTGEIVFERQVSPRLAMNLSAYESRYRDLIQQIDLDVDPGPSVVLRSQFQNLFAARSNGVEAGVDFQVGRLVTGKVNLANQRAVFSQSGDPLINSPEWLANLLLDVPVHGLFTAGLDVHYVGSRLSERPLPDGGLRVDDYLLTNLTLRTRRLLRGSEASLTIYNLLDATYEDPVAPDHIPLATVRQDGRAFRVSFQHRF